VIGRARMAIVSVVNPRRVQGSALPGRDPHETESLWMPNTLMGHAGLIARAAAETLQVLPGAVLAPVVMVHPTLTAVPGHPVIANLARSATMRLVTMTRRLMPMRFRQSLTALPGAS
jgi:hypothetical protein